MNADPALLNLENTFREELPELGLEWSADHAPAPALLAFDLDLAQHLGLDPGTMTSPAGIAAMLGQAHGVAHFAMGYAGHQFGNYSPRLGDGRALLLGELSTPTGGRVDLHLKGSGRTPFSRGGDGKAALGPMLREYLIATAMHALGIPTTRSLAVVATGENIRREGLVPGAVLVRVAASHLRVGTFEYAVRLSDSTVLPRLADYAIRRHYPRASEANNRYLGLLTEVVNSQARLIANWMLVGFIHGVMNTDNMTISGETIDYGPCAFLERYDPRTVFSSIDHAGRYAFGNQPGIAQWNLARFAETLLGLIDADPDAAVAAATEVLETFPQRFQQHLNDGMRAKLGLETDEAEDKELITDLLAAMVDSRVDYTNTFRELAESLRNDGADPAPQDGLGLWRARWRVRLSGQKRPISTIADAMDQVNPLFIPRNHLVEEALQNATDGNLAPFRRLLAAVSQPYLEQPGMQDLAAGATASFTKSYQTFCGT